MPVLSASTAGTASVARIESLDGVRGLAAFAVLLHHLMLFVGAANELTGAPRWDLYISVWPLRLLWGGDEAVVAFFVLSGLVLALPFLRPQRPRWSRFALRRVLRIYPPYLAALTFATFCVWLLAPGRPDELVKLFGLNWQGQHDAAEFLRSALMVNEVQLSNMVLWSIVQEMRISLIFPLLFVTTVFLGIYVSLLLTLVLAMLLSFGALEWGWIAGWGPTSVSYYRTALYLFFFVLGIALACRKDDLLARLAGSWQDFRLALSILGVAAVGAYRNIPFGLGPLVVGVGIATILVVVMSTDRGNRILMSGVPQFLGRISFSLYLLHLPVLLSMVCLLYGMLPLAMIVALAGPVAIFLAWLFWLLVERPSITWSRRVSLG